MTHSIYRISNPLYISALWVFLDTHGLDLVFLKYQGIRALYTAIPKGDIDAEFFIKFSKHITPVAHSDEWDQIPKL